MTLSELLQDIYQKDIPPSFAGREIRGISSDSRSVESGGLFVALRGTEHHGAQFAAQAVARGAVAVVYENARTQDLKDLSSEDACLLKVDDAFSFLKKVLVRFYGQPAGKVRVLGVTGTNGKTTVTYLLESILRAAGKDCGVIGTITHRIGAKALTAKNTTPGLVDNHVFLSELASKGIPYCVMEVSSHALEQNRVDTIEFACAVFTNLTLDHLDDHHDMENYFDVKSRLFARLSPQASAVINADDPYAQRLPSLTKAKVSTYGMIHQAQITAEVRRMDLSGSVFAVCTPLGNINMETSLIGRHNVYNILAAVTSAIGENISPEQIRSGVKALGVVPGRLEAVRHGQDFHVFVDYAHTDDALRNVLTNLRSAGKEARIITVFGCGGNRDISKRPRMGEVSGQLSDWSILTNDNPRNEDPQSIADHVSQGFLNDQYEVILDRHAAIHRALAMAQPGDIVLIAGKGHENYQIFKDKTVHFNDRDAVRDYFQKVGQQ